MENNTRIDGKQIEAPPQLVSERISLMFNNLSESNVPNKAKKVKELIVQRGDSFLQWLAQYLVMKRVMVEKNSEPLYNSLVVAVKDETLDFYIKKETIRNASIILCSNKSRPNSFGDRQILKNLGLWLGTITIARDIPILSKELDMKLLLLDAFYKGQQELLYVVPFIAKTILASGKSTVFKPKSSWIFGIIKILVELHKEPDLNLNLKCEVEVLCNSLGVELRSVEAGSFLNNTRKSQVSRILQTKTMQPAVVEEESALCPMRIKRFVDDHKHFISVFHKYVYQKACFLQYDKKWKLVYWDTVADPEVYMILYHNMIIDTGLSSKLAGFNHVSVLEKALRQSFSPSDVMALSKLHGDIEFRCEQGSDEVFRTESHYANITVYFRAVGPAGTTVKQFRELLVTRGIRGVRSVRMGKGKFRNAPFYVSFDTRENAALAIQQLTNTFGLGDWYLTPEFSRSGL